MEGNVKKKMECKKLFRQDHSVFGALNCCSYTHIHTCNLNSVYLYPFFNKGCELGGSTVVSGHVVQ